MIAFICFVIFLTLAHAIHKERVRADAAENLAAEYKARIETLDQRLFEKGVAVSLANDLLDGKIDDQ